MKYFTFLVFLLLLSCNKIEDSNSLDHEDIRYIENLKLLGKGETIKKFYSVDENKISGNFYTNRRVASYWIDRKNPKKNETYFAYYKEILKFDTVYNAGLTYSPYIIVTKTNGTSFKVFADGSKEEIRAFFEGALTEWKKNK